MNISIQNTREKIDVAILCALDEEFTALQGHLTNQSHQELLGWELILGNYQHRSVLLLKVGIGLLNAATATTAMLLTFNPSLVVFCGIAGALDPSLQIGDTIIAKHCFHAEAITHAKLEPTWPVATAHFDTNATLLSALSFCPKSLLPGYQVTLGTIMSSDFFPAPESFRELVATRAAVAVDMETAAMYHVCQRFNKPCIAVRSISNPVQSAEHEELEATAVLQSAQNAAQCGLQVVLQLTANHSHSLKC